MPLAPLLFSTLQDRACRCVLGVLTPAAPSMPLCLLQTPTAGRLHNHLNAYCRWFLVQTAISGLALTRGLHVVCS